MIKIRSWVTIKYIACVYFIIFLFENIQKMIQNGSDRCLYRLHNGGRLQGSTTMGKPILVPPKCGSNKTVVSRQN